MTQGKVVVAALVASLLAGVFQASASPENSLLPPVQEVAQAPLPPTELGPIVLPCEEPKPIFRDCISACVAERQECYKGCGQDWNCRGWCDTAFNTCLSQCSP